MALAWLWTGRRSILWKSRLLCHLLGVWVMLLLHRTIRMLLRCRLRRMRSTWWHIRLAVGILLRISGPLSSMLLMIHRLVVLGLRDLLWWIATGEALVAAGEPALRLLCLSRCACRGTMRIARMCRHTLCLALPRCAGIWHGIVSIRGRSLGVLGRIR